MPDSKNDVSVADGAESDVDDGGPCKWGPIEPSCCQRFRNPKWVLFWLCCIAATQGMLVTGFINVVITTIEKRFGISSTESGTVASCYDIASAICLLPVTYFGGYGVRPRYIGIGVITLGIGSFLFALPHFTTDKYTVDITQDSLCTINEISTSTCDNTFLDGSLSNYKYVFVAALLLVGAGASPFYTLGVTYLDDSLPPRSSSLYIGIFYATVVLGTATGYLAGGEFLKVWTDVGSVDVSSITITPDNRRWVGAWWLGFIIVGVLAFLIAIPISGFPEILPGTSKYRKERGSVVHSKNGKDAKDDAEKTDDSRADKKNDNDDVTVATDKPKSGSRKKFSLKNVWQATRVLLTNPTFMFLNLVAATEAMLVAGFSTFTPKFLESQFSQPAASAAQFVGFAAIPAGAGGTVLGGYLVKKFNPRVSTTLKCCIVSSIIVVILMLIFLINCENVPFAGINTKYQNSSTSVRVQFLGKQLPNPCNDNCGCTEDDYRPVCGRDGIMYFSPCYAGCQALFQGSTTHYTNCSCISSSASDYMAEFVSCETPCILLPAFLCVFAVMMLLTFLVSIPAVAVTLRCVPDYDRSYALGIQYLVLRLLGSIPGPIIFGKMIDLACLLWQKRCDGDGSCFFYDNRSFSYNLMALGIVIKSLSCIFFILSLIFYKKPPEESSKVTDITVTVSKPTTPNGIANQAFENNTGVGKSGNT